MSVGTFLSCYVNVCIFQLLLFHGLQFFAERLLALFIVGEIKCRSASRLSAALRGRISIQRPYAAYGSESFIYNIYIYVRVCVRSIGSRYVYYGKIDLLSVTRQSLI